MLYFRKAGSSRISDMTLTGTRTDTKTKTNTKTKTKCLKDPSHAIFSKSREFKDIKYDTYRIQP